MPALAELSVEERERALSRFRLGAPELEAGRELRTLADGSRRVLPHPSTLGCAIPEIWIGCPRPELKARPRREASGLADDTEGH